MACAATRCRARWGRTTEHKLFDIRNNNLTLPRIINYSSTDANRQVCINAGFTAAECGTHYLDRSTWVKMITPATSSVQLYDAFAAVKAVQQASANKALLMLLDPADPTVFWLPSQAYAYAVAL